MEKEEDFFLIWQKFLGCFSHPKKATLIYQEISTCNTYKELSHSPAYNFQHYFPWEKIFCTLSSLCFLFSLGYCHKRKLFIFSVPLYLN